MATLGFAGSYKEKEFGHDWLKVLGTSDLL